MIKVIKAGSQDVGNFLRFFEESLSKKNYFLYPKKSASYIINGNLPEKKILQKEILNERPLYLVYEGENIIAYLLTKKVWAGVGFGHWLAVNRTHRNKGYATKLLKMWEKDALKDGAHSIHLYTTENDLGFYKKKGFTLGGKFEKGWFGIDHYLFYKNISNPNPKKFV